jgi:hypothetical protein
MQLIGELISSAVTSSGCQFACLLLRPAKPCFTMTDPFLLCLSQALLLGNGVRDGFVGFFPFIFIRYRLSEKERLMSVTS